MECNYNFSYTYDKIVSLYLIHKMPLNLCEWQKNQRPHNAVLCHDYMLVLYIKYLANLVYILYQNTKSGHYVWLRKQTADIFYVHYLVSSHRHLCRCCSIYRKSIYKICLWIFSNFDIIKFLLIYSANCLTTPLNSCLTSVYTIQFICTISVYTVKNLICSFISH